MTLIDYNAQFCDEDTITATVANAIVGDVYDTSATPTLKDIGLNAKPMYLVISIDEAVTSNGSATVAFTLLSDSTANLATSATTHINTGDIAIATLVKGYKMIFPLPPGNYERYVGIFANTKVQTLNAGTVSAYLTMDPPKWTALPDGL
jgi:hypothetical protein